MTKKISLFAAVIAILVSNSFFSCAYFNTYYNTKKFYNEALQETEKRTSDKPGSTERQKFDKTINQASKVLQLYPESKYVDDALLILGKSFFYIEDYRKAERKFLELIDIYPNSENIEEAELWLAKTQISLERYDLAFPELQKMQQNAKSKDIRNESQYWLGEACFQQELYLEATKEFNAALGDLGDDEMRAKTYNRLGECYLELESYFRAAENFESAAKYTRRLDRRFDLGLQHAKALNLAGNHDDAIEKLDALIARNDQHKNLSLAKLELANSYMSKNATEKAIEIYNDIIELHPRTTAAAGAYLALAQYDEEVLNNYETAEDNYRQAALQDNRSDFAKTANEKAANINELRKLQKSIAELQEKLIAKAPDSTNSESSGRLGFDDSIDDVRARRNTLPNRTSANRGAENDPGRGKTKKQSNAVEQDEVASQRARSDAPTPRGRNQPGRPAENENTKSLTQAQKDSIELLITGQKIQLAETFYFDFAQTDSALFYYLDAISGSNSREFRALAFYSIAQIYENQTNRAAVRDSVLKILAYNYQDTPQGTAARAELGLAPQQQKETNTFSSVFAAAEDLYLRQNKPRAAEKKLLSLLEVVENENEKMKAIYTLGWLNEHQLQENDRALSYYKQLVESYPTSEFAKRVNKKIISVEQAKQAAEEANSEQKSKTVMTDSTATKSPAQLPPPELKTEAKADSSKSTQGQRPDREN